MTKFDYKLIIELLGETEDIIDNYYWWIVERSVARSAEVLGCTIIYSHRSSNKYYYHVFLEKK